MNLFNRRKVKKMLLIAISGIAIFGVAACQATPDTKAVVGKAGSLEKQIESSAAPIHEYNIPSRYKTEFNSYNGALRVTADAEIELPETKEFPVYSVSYAPFTQEQTDDLVAALMQGEKIYTVDENFRTKGEIEDELIHIKELYSQVRRGKYGEVKDTTSYTDRIGELEAELGNAPDEENHSLSDGMLISDETGSHLNVEADLGKGKEADLKIENDSSINVSVCSFLNGNEYFEDGSGRENEKVNGIDLSPEGARSKAQQFLEDANLTNFVPVSVRKGSLYSSGDEKEDAQGYVVNCTRVVHNIPVTLNRAAGSDQKATDLDHPDAYTPMLENERMILTFDDSGLTSFLWENPIDMKQMNENAALMEFEEIAQHFKQSMINKYSWLNEPEGVEGKVAGTEVYINRTTLGYAKAPKKDDLEAFTLIPVWDFFGEYTFSYKSQDDSTVNNEFTSFVTLSAIDGSIINLSS